MTIFNLLFVLKWYFNCRKFQNVWKFFKWITVLTLSCESFDVIEIFEYLNLKIRLRFFNVIKDIKAPKI